jgi:hypothetical protein
MSIPLGGLLLDDNKVDRGAGGTSPPSLVGLCPLCTDLAPRLNRNRELLFVALPDLPEEIRSSRWFSPNFPPTPSPETIV